MTEVPTPDRMRHLGVAVRHYGQGVQRLSSTQCREIEACMQALAFIAEHCRENGRMDVYQATIDEAIAHHLGARKDGTT